MENFVIDHIEIYCPMAKTFAYWHMHALGFGMEAIMNSPPGMPGLSSYVLKSNAIRLVLTSTYPVFGHDSDAEVRKFVDVNHCGVKRVALRVESVKQTFDECVSRGAIPVKLPWTVEDSFGSVNEASIKLYDNSEILFIERDNYNGSFKPGYEPVKVRSTFSDHLCTIDHIASEVRVNESRFWSKYLSDTVGTMIVQEFGRGSDNRTGMTLNVNQSKSRALTFVIAEPADYNATSKVQQNIEAYGPGVHHLAFTTHDLKATVKEFSNRGVEFVTFPKSYYELLRGNPEFKGMDIDSFEEAGIIVDKEGDTFLLQKFLKPVSDRPFFIYEIVQRVNGYSGFAIKNINVLKQAEEVHLTSR